MTSIKEKMEKISKYNKKSANKAISPVIASIILIAITIAIAVAIGGFVFGLFGSFTQSGGVQVISPTLDVSDYAFRASVLNTKDSSVTISSVVVTGDAGVLLSGTGPVPATVFTAQTVPATPTGDWDLLPLTALTAGTSYTVRVTFSDGTQTAVVVTASP